MLTYLPDSHFLGASGGHARFHSLVLKHGDGNVNEASVSLQAGNESLRLVATIAAYLAAIVGLCGRSPKLPTIKPNYAFNRGYQKCPNSSRRCRYAADCAGHLC